MPWFDPADGGIDARVMILLETPSRAGTLPRFVSIDNPSPTQRNLRACVEASGLRRPDLVLWNVSPWIGDADANGRLSAAQVRAGIVTLPALLAHLPALQCVVLSGRVAQRARTAIETARPDIHVLAMPHPSPLSLCRSPDVVQRIRSTLAQAAVYAARAR